MNKKLIFLHIPKTAGQSVFQYLENTFDKSDICPFRVDSQYENDSIDPDKFLIHSGHIDWKRLEDSLSGEKVYFSVLRKPIDRILSYYFYIRKEAEKLTDIELLSADRAGMRAALQLTPDEYFVDCKGELREFIDDHYDNFYLNYFSGKTYNSRRINKNVKKSVLLKRAIINLNGINGLYTLDNWMEVKDLIRDKMGVTKFPVDSHYFTNTGDGLSVSQRLENLKELGATEKSINRINEMCKFDNLIYEYASLLSQS